jgi:type II secretory pathway pseudopilin PulG
MLRHPSITGRRSAAFTLVELLVVISIIIILLAVSIPTIRALTKSNSQKQAVNLLTSLLANARATAISTHKVSGIVVYEYPAVSNGQSNEATSYVQLITQSAYNGSSKVRFFTRVPRTTPQRLPSGIQAATIDVGVNSFRTQAVDTSNSDQYGGTCRVILFDSTGQLLMTNSIAADTTLKNDDPTVAAWNMNGDQSATRGSSSPGFLVYDAVLFNQSHHTPPVNDATWLQQNSDVIILNAYTGNVIR